MTFRSRLGLRRRTVAAFAVGALFLSSTLSLLTYELARWYLLRQRQTLATQQAVVNAGVAKSRLGETDVDPGEIVSALAGSSAARSLLYRNGAWFGSSVDFGQNQIPTDLQGTIATTAARQRTIVGGQPYVVTAIPLRSVEAQYVEFAPLRELARTLRVLAYSLMAAALVTVLLGALFGWWISRRLLRPLTLVANAARSISSGDLATRVNVDADPDLMPLAESFNHMASALEERIEREVRFTADVSHELRTPLTAMLSALHIASKADMPPRAAHAIEVADRQAGHLRDLVQDLLEIARFDAHTVALNLEPTDLSALVRESLDNLGHAGCLKVVCDPGVVRVDRRRVERVLANLVENADRYAGGVVAVTVERIANAVAVHVDDAGPGVPQHERRAIFGRFNRGVASSQPTSARGTGLGLSLAEEHVRLHGGTIYAGTSPYGGARFTFELPLSNGSGDD
ncbi:MAG: ATP-binding protein [Acidimicrobiia bacterium]